MKDPQTGLEVPPEIAAAMQSELNQSFERMKIAEAKSRFGDSCSHPGCEKVETRLSGLCPKHDAEAMASLLTAPRYTDSPSPPSSAPHQPPLIPFDEFERRIKLLRENGVRSYQDPYMRVQIDTYKRQPDPAALLAETFST